MKLEHHIDYFRRSYNRPAQVTFTPTVLPDEIARFAMQLLATPGLLLVGEPDGEDSAGRAKGKRMPVSDVVAFAFDIAEAAYEAAESRGHLLDVPEHDVCDELAKDRDKKN